MGALPHALATAVAEADELLAAAGGTLPELRGAVWRAHGVLWAGLCALPDPAAAPPSYRRAVGLCSFTPSAPAALRGRIREIRAALAGEVAE